MLLRSFCIMLVIIVPDTERFVYRRRDLDDGAMPNFARTHLTVRQVKYATTSKTRVNTMINHHGKYQNVVTPVTSLVLLPFCP